MAVAFRPKKQGSARQLGADKAVVLMKLVENKRPVGILDDPWPRTLALSQINSSSRHATGKLTVLNWPLSAPPQSSNHLLNVLGRSLLVGSACYNRRP